MGDVCGSANVDLQDLGYYYDEKGTFRQTANDEKFVFKDQKHYDILSEAVQREIGKLLLVLTKEVTTKTGVPIFVSDLSAKKILVLIQGAGRVQPGVWGCSICINEDEGLEKGTMLSYIKAAHANNYGVIIFNPNHQSLGRAGSSQHVLQAWEEFVKPLADKGIQIDVVAHSNGAKNFVHVLEKGGTMAHSVRRVAFTDGYHSIGQVERLSPIAKSVFRKAVINYVCSEEKFGTSVERWLSLGHEKTADECGCPCISAECTDHAMTNFAAMKDIFAWFAEEGERTFPSLR